MILVDTSIWIDHLHAADSTLVSLLSQSMVATHPMVIGELALGSLRDRKKFLELLADLPPLPAANHDEVLYFVNEKRLYGKGLSLVDAHLLASVRLSSGARLWTRDKRLATVARTLGVVFHGAYYNRR
ncbi:MAG: type II toxin-antitoxin system VapC family toxin [Sciscionella sp.]|nr:type II toxin-antitoxin system VapC family toxin [Sciscionella sp.]